MKTLFSILLSSALALPAMAQNGNGTPDWAHSYAVDGQCYCLMDRIDDYQGHQVDTPGGNVGAPVVCGWINSKLGVGSLSNRKFYGSLQCGYEPISSKDANCPGQRGDCTAKGSKWSLGKLWAPDG